MEEFFFYILHLHSLLCPRHNKFSPKSQSMELKLFHPDQGTVRFFSDVRTDEFWLQFFSFVPILIEGTFFKCQKQPIQ
jgi:hypothetical protein